MDLCDSISALAIGLHLRIKGLPPLFTRRSLRQTILRVVSQAARYHGNTLAGSRRWIRILADLLMSICGEQCLKNTACHPHVTTFVRKEKKMRGAWRL